MDAVLTELVQLVGGEDRDLRISAAKVLAVVEITNEDATAALVTHLKKADAELKSFILESLSRRGGRQAGEALVGFLGEEGRVGELAAHAVATAGESAPKLLKAVVLSGTPGQFRAAVEVLVTLENEDARNLLGKALFKTDRMACASFAVRVVRNSLENLPAAWCSFFAQRAEATLKIKGIGKGIARAANALKFLGMLAKPEYARYMFKFCRKNNHTEVRRAAISGLAQLKNGDIDAGELGKLLLPMLDESDFTDVVKPCLDVLWKNPLPAELRPQLAHYLNSSCEPVKRYALKELERVGSVREVKDLLACLDSGNYDLSERAAGELRRIEDALLPLLKKLEMARDFESARRYASILMSHQQRLSGSRLNKIVSRMVELFAKGDERAKAFLWLVRTVRPGLAAEKLIEAARVYRRKRKFDHAERCLRVLLSGNNGSPQTHYEMAILLLKRAKHVFDKEQRAQDVGLTELSGIIAEHKIDLVKLLSREKDLQDEDCYYIGYHFSESIGDERKLGVEILTVLSRKRGKYAKQATQKLIAEGVLPAGKSKGKLKVAGKKIKPARTKAKTKIKTKTKTKVKTKTKTKTKVKAKASIRKK